jgi:transcriptional regulator with GAF, ATPase, and Fis domain
LRIAGAITAPLPDAQARLLAGVSIYPDAGATGDALIERSRQALRRTSAAHPVELAPARAWTADPAAEEAIVADPAMRELFATIDRVAPSRLPVILHGETGTGKEVLARRIHEAGPRKARRMVRVNCAAIPKELVESTLFGHERGAFTGAVQQQKGVFEEANGGTVFLDEIGELPSAAQAALLRVLESSSFCRVGSTREITVDVRIVVATNRDLEAMVNAGAFRADLYYRLSGIVLEIPPLRERTVEIEPLARRFLRLANDANGRKVEGIAKEAMGLLMAHSWPGNVRELRNAIERAVVVTPGALVGPADLPARVRAAKADPERVPEPAHVSPFSPAPPVDSLAPPLSRPPDLPHAAAPARDKLQQYEGKLLRDTLEATEWNRAEAAQRLGMPIRTLSYRMKVLGIKKPRP